jgi:hypothetical protein
MSIIEEEEEEEEEEKLKSFSDKGRGHSTLETANLGA